MVGQRLSDSEVCHNPRRKPCSCTVKMHGSMDMLWCTLADKVNDPKWTNDVGFAISCFGASHAATSSTEAGESCRAVLLPILPALGAAGLQLYAALSPGSQLVDVYKRPSVYLSRYGSGLRQMPQKPRLPSSGEINYQASGFRLQRISNMGIYYACSQALVFQPSHYPMILLNLLNCKLSRRNGFAQ
jgi:hypothetical protein